MSLQRGCQFCGRRLRGTMPGACTIMFDGQPLDASVVLCGEHAHEIVRVLSEMRQRSIIAQQARSVAVTQQITRVPDAVTEHYATLPADLAERFDREAHGRWPDCSELETVVSNAYNRRRWPRRRH